jgi:transcriptional regulator with XRE-family HTH domain
MAYPAYLRNCARELRTTKHLSLEEIAERLALPKTTVYYWIRDLPLGRERNWSPGQRKGNRVMQNKRRVLRGEAYAQGARRWAELINLSTFRDFIVLYIAEGYKRSRNTASRCNSDPAIVALATPCFRRLSTHSPAVSVQSTLTKTRMSCGHSGPRCSPSIPAGFGYTRSATAVNYGAASGAAVTASRR